MVILHLIGQFLLFFVLLRVGHILYFNIGRRKLVHYLWLEALVAVVTLGFFYWVHNVWFLAPWTGFAIGLIRGDHELRIARHSQAS